MCHCKNYEGAMFNKDYCHATPAFILPSEKVLNISHRKIICKALENFCGTIKIKLKSTSSNPTIWYLFFDIVYRQTAIQIYVLQCVSRNLSIICGCRCRVIQHIKGFHHRNNARSSTFNNYILELEGEFKLKNTKEPRLSSAEISNRISNEEEA